MIIALIAFVLVVLVVGLVVACIDWRASRHHKQSMKALEKSQRKAIRGDREIEQLQRAYNEACERVKAARKEVEVILEREQFRADMRDSVSPQANRRLRHLMID